MHYDVLVCISVPSCAFESEFLLVQLYLRVVEDLFYHQDLNQNFEHNLCRSICFHCGRMRGKCSEW